MLIGLENIDAFHTSSDYIISGGVNMKLNYYSVNQLYYSSFSPTEGSIIESSSFDNYIESSFTSASRFMSDSGVAYSIPRNMFGTHLEPGTVSIGSGSYYLYDDGEGNLIRSSTQERVGNVIYSHGQILITDEYVYDEFRTYPGQPISWSGNLPIYTFNYSVKLSDYEYNYTYNPTAQSGSYTLYVDELGDEVASSHPSASRFVRTTGVLADNITGSAFQPYITTVGLYNEANELLAVGKLAQPLPKPANTELTIQIKLDM